MKYALLVVLALAISPCFALAGGNDNDNSNNNGGGSKNSNNSTLRIQNVGKQRLAVLVNGSSGVNPSSETLQSFLNKGGRIVEVGETTTLSTRSGNQRIQAAFIRETTTAQIGKTGTLGVNMQNGDDTTVRINGNAATGPIFSVHRNSGSGSNN